MLFLNNFVAGISQDCLQAIATKVFNAFMQATLIVLHKLDLSTKERSLQIMDDPVNIYFFEQ